MFFTLFIPGAKSQGSEGKKYVVVSKYQENGVNYTVWGIKINSRVKRGASYLQAYEISAQEEHVSSSGVNHFANELNKLGIVVIYDIELLKLRKAHASFFPPKLEWSTIQNNVVESGPGFLFVSSDFINKPTIASRFEMHELVHIMKYIESRAESTLYSYEIKNTYVGISLLPHTLRVSSPSYFQSYRPMIWDDISYSQSFSLDEILATSLSWKFSVEGLTKYLILNEGHLDPSYYQNDLSLLQNKLTEVLDYLSRIDYMIYTAIIALNERLSTLKLLLNSGDKELEKITMDQLKTKIAHLDTNQNSGLEKELSAIPENYLTLIKLEGTLLAPDISSSDKIKMIKAYLEEEQDLLKQTIENIIRLEEKLITGNSQFAVVSIFQQLQNLSLLNPSTNIDKANKILSDTRNALNFLIPDICSTSLNKFLDI